VRRRSYALLAAEFGLGEAADPAARAVKTPIAA
jgi:hypothetical protein